MFKISEEIENSSHSHISSGFFSKPELKRQINPFTFVCCLLKICFAINLILTFERTLVYSGEIKWEFKCSYICQYLCEADSELIISSKHIIILQHYNASACSTQCSRFPPIFDDAYLRARQKRTESEPSWKGKTRKRRQWHPAIVAGLRCTDKAAHATLPSSAMIPLSVSPSRECTDSLYRTVSATTDNFAFRPVELISHNYIHLISSIRN